jgi:hypothetical protein
MADKRMKKMSAMSMNVRLPNLLVYVGVVLQLQRFVLYRRQIHPHKRSRLGVHGQNHVALEF